MVEKENKKNSVKLRLDEIEKEIAELSSQRDELTAHWNLEKGLIKQIRTAKEEIENLKLEAEKLEREGNLAKVAELRYGKIPLLEKDMAEKRNSLETIQKDRKMLKEEVDAEDIAEIVSKWTGIPVNKMLESSLPWSQN